MYIKVRAYPNSKKELVEQKKENTFDIFVREPAERNLANKRICELLSERFGNPCGGVKIINGHFSAVKLIRVGDD